jgi:hypothetical protein
MTLRQEILAAFGCGAVVGGVVAAVVLDRRYRLKYAELADEEIAEMKEIYAEKERDLIEFQEKVARRPKPDLEKITENLKERAKAELISEGEGYVQPVTQEDIEELQEREEAEQEEINAFVDLPPWNYDKELASRNGDKPFITHLEEYQQSECSHQITITYFEGDDVLVDEADEVISKKDEVVGMENLTKFGYGSNDLNVVYVRNPKLDIEYEILRHQGHYAKEILGLEEDPSLEHSAIPRRHLKFDDGT